MKFRADTKHELPPSGKYLDVTIDPPNSVSVIALLVSERAIPVIEDIIMTKRKRTYTCSQM
jgi:hypothetical protein